MMAGSPNTPPAFATGYATIFQGQPCFHFLPFPQCGRAPAASSLHDHLLAGKALPAKRLDVAGFEQMTMRFTLSKNGTYRDEFALVEVVIAFAISTLVVSGMIYGKQDSSRPDGFDP